MTIMEARQEARDRWGLAGVARIEIGKGYVVGTVGGEKLPNGSFPYGCGNSWEAAFADADLRSTAPLADGRAR